MIIGLIVPNNYWMPFKSVKCWLKLKGYEIVSFEGPDLNFNRNKIFEMARYKDDDFMMIDSDIVFNLKQVQRIEEHLKTYDAITGIYNMGQEPYPPCIFKRVPGNYVPCEVEEGINEIGACGGGFLGISKRVMKAMPKDPFDNIKEGDVFHGEDITFCHRLKENGFKLYADSNIRVGHLRLLEK